MCLSLHQTHKQHQPTLCSNGGKQKASGKKTNSLRNTQVQPVAMGRVGPTVITTDVLNLAAEDRDEERFDLRPLWSLPTMPPFMACPPTPHSSWQRPPASKASTSGTTGPPWTQAVQSSGMASPYSTPAKLCVRDLCNLRNATQTCSQPHSSLC